jgi:hypothetical protein
MGRWLNGCAIQDLAPTLVSPVDHRALHLATVAEALPKRKWVKHISGGLTDLAIQEYLDVWDQVRDIELSNAQDTLVWRWTGIECTPRDELTEPYTGDHTPSRLRQDLENLGTTLCQKYSYGWLCNTSTGLLTGECTMDSKPPSTASCVTKNWSPSTTSLLRAPTPDKYGGTS